VCVQGGAGVRADVRGRVVLHAPCRQRSSQPGRHGRHAAHPARVSHPMSALHRVAVSRRHHWSWVRRRRDRAATPLCR